MKRLNAAVRVASMLAATFTLVFSSQAGSGEKYISIANQKQTSAHAIHIVDQNGQPAVSGVPSGGGQIFDVAVGQGGLTFDPKKLNIWLVKTVRWICLITTPRGPSATPFTPRGKFCSPDDLNCD